MPTDAKYKIGDMVWNGHTSFKHRVINVKPTIKGFFYRLQGYSASVHEKDIYLTQQDLLNATNPPEPA